MSNVAFVLPSDIEYDLYTYLYFLKETINEYKAIDIDIDIIVPSENSKNIFSKFLSTINNRSHKIEANKYSYTWSNPALHSPLNVYYYLSDYSYKTIISFDTSAETYFCIYGKSIGYCHSDVTFRVISVQPTWFPIVNHGKMFSSVDIVILAGLEEFVVKNADVLEGNYCIYDAIYRFTDKHKHRKSISCTKTYKVEPNGNIALYWGATNHPLGIVDFVKSIAMMPDNKDIEVIIISTDQVDRKSIARLFEDYRLKEHLKYITHESKLNVSLNVFDNILFCYIPNVINYYGLVGITGKPDFPVIVSKPLLLRGMNLGKKHMDYPAATSIYKYIEKINSNEMHDNLELLSEVTIEDLHSDGGGIIPENAYSSEGSLVSVCIVHYNRPKLLKYAIESILAQDYPQLEIVISDDGSRSDVISEIREMLDFEPFVDSAIPIKLIEYKNSYLGAARNRAVKHASGAYILFMDDDNYAMPHEISTLVNIALKNPNALFVGSFMAVFNSNNIDNVEWNNSDIFSGLGCTNLAGMLQNNFSDANGLYRVDKLKKLGGFSEDYGIGYEDWELFFKAQKINMQVIIVPEPLFYYRINEGNSMARNHISPLVSLNRVARVLFQNRNETDISNEYFYNMLLLQGVIYSESLPPEYEA